MSPYKVLSPVPFMLLFTIIFTDYSLAQNDLSAYEVTGEISILKSRIYIPDASSRPSALKIFDSNQWSTNYDIEFDREGRCTKKYVLNRFGERELYKVYTHDEIKTNVIKALHTGLNYDRKGRILRKNSFGTSFYLYSYLDDGIYDKRFYQHSNSLYIRERFDENDNLIWKDTYNKDERLALRTLHKYNDRGLLISSSYLDFINEQHDYDAVTFRYQYDVLNNWIEKQEYQDGKLILITIREITYFN